MSLVEPPPRKSARMRFLQVFHSVSRTSPRAPLNRSHGSSLLDCRTLRLADRRRAPRRAVGGSAAPPRCTGAQIGPTRAGRARAARRRAEPAERLLHRLRQRRRLALDRLRLELGAALRRRAAPARSARSPWRRRTRTSSTSARAPGSSAPTSPPATACTSRPTPARRGRTSACATAQMIAHDRRRSDEPEPAVRRRARPSVRAERRARHLPLDRRRARRSRRCCTRTSTRAATTSASTRAIRTSSTPRSGSSSRASSRAAGSAAAANGIFKSTDGGTTWKQLDRRAAAGARRRTSRSRRAIRRSLYAMVAAAAPPGGGAAAAAAVAVAAASASTSRPTAASTGMLAVNDPSAPAQARAPDNRPLVRIGGGDLPTIAVDPKNENVVYSSSTVFWRTEDGGLHLVRRARRARRRRLSEDVDQPEQPGHPPRRRRSGRRGLGESRQVVEQLVHAADRRDVSRHDRQRVPVSRLRRPAGLRLGVRRQPLDGRRDHVPRLASGQHPGVRHRRARSEGSRSGVRQPAHQRLALQPQDGPDDAPSVRPSAGAARHGLTVATCARCRSTGRRSTRTCCSTRRTSCGRRSTRRTAGRASAPTSRGRRGPCRRTPGSTRAA